jgi:archaellum biogenesis ATPase FlaH
VRLAYAVLSLQTYIRGAISKRSDITNLSLLDQWRLLVFGPLLRIEKSPRPYVLIINALDECEDNNNIRTILELLAEARLLKTVRLRIFITSRPEILIRHGIRHIP